MAECLGRCISTWSMAAMLHNVFIIFRCRRAHEPMIRSTAHANYEKRVAWFSIYACCSLPIVFVLHLAALWAARAAL